MDTCTTTHPFAENLDSCRALAAFLGLLAAEVLP